MTADRASEIEAELVRIADELDQLEPKVVAKQARRNALWREGREIGITSIDLARWSRKRPVTVRKAANTKGENP